MTRAIEWLILEGGGFGEEKKYDWQNKNTPNLKIRLVEKKIRLAKKYAFTKKYAWHTEMKKYAWHTEKDRPLESGLIGCFYEEAKKIRLSYRKRSFAI
ncbi:MAG: hypothetical protein ACJAVK_003647 [Akkermansiaceae bacterium]|jgi:hypothetical protein